MKPREGFCSASGFLTIELLVSAGLGMLVLAMVMSLLLGHVHSMTRLCERSQALVDLHWAIETMVADLQIAGLDPMRRSISEPLRLSRHGFFRAADLDGDGVIDARSSEVVAYRVSEQGDLIRQIGRQSMTILDGWGRADLTLRAFDGNGEPLDLPVEGSLSTRSVSRVAISIGTVRADALHVSVALRWISRAESDILSASGSS